MRVFCDASVAKALGKAGVPNEQGGMHVAANVRRSSLEEMHAELQLVRYVIVHGRWTRSMNRVPPLHLVKREMLLQMSTVN